MGIHISLSIGMAVIVVSSGRNKSRKERETTKYDNDPPARAEPLITGSSSSSNLKVPRVFPFPLLPCCLLFSCLKPGRSVAPGAFHSFLSLYSFFLCSKQTAFFCRCRCRRRRRETKTRLRSGNI